jgi:hypothetical protein
VLFDAGGTLIHLDGARICRAAGLDADLALFSQAEAESMAAMRAWIAEHPESTDAERLPLFLAGILGRLGLYGEDVLREAGAEMPIEATT